MQRSNLLRYAAYPLVFGGVASFVILWTASGYSPWPGFALVALVGIGLVAVLERLQPFEPVWNNDHGDSFTDVLHLMVNLVLLVATAYLLHAVAARIPLVSVWPQTWPIGFQILLAGAVLDLGLYAMHRLSHHVPWLWRLHAVHHSAERLYWMNGERRHPASAVLLAGPGLLTSVLLGAPALIISAWLAMLSVHLAFQHANLDYSLGPLRRWIGGAELHRWHHRRDYADSEVNFGEFWLIWDWLFGTRYDEPGLVGAADVGLLDEGFPKRYVGQLLWPFTSRRDQI